MQFPIRRGLDRKPERLGKSFGYFEFPPPSLSPSLPFLYLSLLPPHLWYHPQKHSPHTRIETGISQWPEAHQLN